jgi:hypothetical protein
MGCCGNGEIHFGAVYEPLVTDTTPPEITPYVSGTLGDNDWYVSDVTVSWTVTDPESDISETSGCGTTVIDADTAGITLECTATSAGGTASESVTIKRDATPPTASASASPGPNTNGWNNSDVTVSFSGTDNLSGIATCDAAVVLTGEGAGQSASGTCTDLAGNVSAPATASGINIDKTAPLVADVVANPNPVQVNTAIELTALVDGTDAGGSNTDSADYSLDGGAWTSMTASDGAFDSPIEGVQASVAAFAEAGVHELCVRGADAADNQSAEECILLAVYDPEGGFVTGGGWIMSPAEACPDFCGGATGKANFGFVSKYKKGADTPTGQTEFQFKAGDLNFHSSSYDWLVIAGANAKYKGVGTINGEGNYGFMLTATDEDLTPSTDVDLFRIKIWDKDAGDDVVYDNKWGESDDGYAGTEIGGGNIKIHKGK